MPTADDGGIPLPREVRGFIVLLAMLQGLVLWLLATGQENGWPGFESLNGLVCWYTLVLSVPTAMALTVRRLDETRFWQHAGLLLVVFLSLAWWAGRSVTGAPALDASAILGPFGGSLAIALFIATPYLQCRLQHLRWCAPYRELFDHAWQNALTLLVMVAFVGICWMVLALWAGLFKLIGIDWFSHLFRDNAFIYLATGTLAGLGVLLGRSENRPVQLARRLLLATFTGLLPVLALVALLFVASLPFTGLESLWATRSATTVLLLLLAAMVLFTNAVYQDGDSASPYPVWLRRVVSAGLVSLPVFAVLAGYAMWLRIAQYGWTSERFWAVLLTVLVSTHAFGYAWAALRPGGKWLQRLEPVNITVSLLAIGLLLAGNSPVLDPHRLASSSQVERLVSGVTAPADFDVDYLRFSAGRVGYLALTRTASHPVVTGNPILLERVEAAIARQQRYPRFLDDDQLARTAVTDPHAARKLITVVGMPPSASWWTALLGHEFAAGGCLQPGAECLVLTRDLDGDGRPEQLLCDLTGGWGTTCHIQSLANNDWRGVAAVTFSDQDGEVHAALRQDQLRIKPRRWPDLEAAGQRSTVDGEDWDMPDPSPHAPDSGESEAPSG